MSSSNQPAGWARAYWSRRSRRGKVTIIVLAVLVVFGLIGAFSEPEAEPSGIGNQVSEPAARQPKAKTRRAVVETTAAKAAPVEEQPAGVVVSRVVDGDTIKLATGKVVRLVQIDAPELRGGECYATQSAATLRELLPAGTRVRVEADPALDAVDGYDRQLAYVFKGSELIQHTLVARGAATPWFYNGAKGAHADTLFAAAQNARAGGRGLWKACAATQLNVTKAIATRRPAPPPPLESVAPVAAPAAAPATNCHPSYQGACLDPNASDYDCAGGSGNGPQYTGYVRVVGPDDYELDRDGDGDGCEDG